MNDVVHQKCFCGLYRPIFGLAGERPTHCAACRTDDMVDVVNRMCFCGNHRPCFGLAGTERPTHCAACRTDEMVDVVNRMCESCTKHATFNILGQPARFCADHKKKGMIKSPTRTCEFVSCTELGTHEADGGRFCESHMPAGAENLGLDKCDSCGLTDVLSNGKCRYCDPKVIIQRKHAKEDRVKAIFAAEFQNPSFTHNRTLEGAKCGLERPDFQFDCGTHCVYVEVDEHQHSTYPCQCEQTRMVNLVNVRHMPVRWIRYNPDVYEPIEGQRNISIKDREKQLIACTKFAIKNAPPPGTISDILYLFYDEYDEKQHWLMLIAADEVASNDSELRKRTHGESSSSSSSSRSVV